MTGSNAELFGDDYAARIRASLPGGMSPDFAHVCPSGLVMVVTLGRHSAIPLGCPLCLGREPEQDAQGLPHFAGRFLVQPDHEPRIPITLAANLWLCPQCRTPIASLLPKFTR